MKLVFPGIENAPIELPLIRAELLRIATSRHRLPSSIHPSIQPAIDSFVPSLFYSETDVPKLIYIPENHSKRRETGICLQKSTQNQPNRPRKEIEMVDEVARRRVTKIIAKNAV